MIDTEFIVAVSGIILIAAVIYGFIRKVKRYGVSSIQVDALLNEVGGIISNELSGILNKEGITADYESFKDYVIKQLLKKARKYFDEKGGTIDEITDAISDEDIIDAINAVIDIADIEVEIKKVYDNLVYARLKEIEDSDAEVEAENNKIETEDLSQYTEEESDTVEEELESDDIKVDEE